MRSRFDETSPPDVSQRGGEAIEEEHAKLASKFVRLELLYTRCKGG